MNGWNKINKYRYELMFDNKDYLTAVYYRTPIIENNIEDMEENLFIENSLIYNSSIINNPPFLYREYKKINTRKISITETLKIVQFEYLLISLIRKKELIDNINNNEYLNILKKLYGNNYDKLIEFIYDNYDKLYKLSEEIIIERNKNNDSLLYKIDDIISNPNKYKVLNKDTNNRC